VLHTLEHSLLSLSLELNLLSLLYQKDPMQVKIHTKEVGMMEMLGTCHVLVAKLVSLHSTRRQKENLNGFHLYVKYVWCTVGNTSKRSSIIKHQCTDWKFYLVQCSGRVACSSRHR